MLTECEGLWAATHATLGKGSSYRNTTPLPIPQALTFAFALVLGKYIQDGPAVRILRSRGQSQFEHRELPAAFCETSSTSQVGLRQTSPEQTPTANALISSVPVLLVCLVS